MFIKDCSKQYAHKYSPCLLLTESYRDEKGIPRHRIIMNLSKLPKPLEEVIINQVKGKKMVSLEDICQEDNRSLGEVLILKKLSDRVGLTKILQKHLGNLVSNLVLATALNRISLPKAKYSLRNWLETTYLPEILKTPLSEFHYNKLYQALEVLAEKQDAIEDDLWEITKQQEEGLTLMLYDITSTYLEGWENQLAAFGYNRDGKKGKKQLVIGLITTKEGRPVSVEVFRGNTTDKTTLIKKIKDTQKRFHIKEVIYVFDRGMKDEPKLATLRSQDIRYITALTRKEIKKLLENNSQIQLGLFDKQNLAEYEIDNRRYIICKSDQERRNRRTREILLEKTEEKMRMIKRNVSNGRWKNPAVIAARTERWLRRWKMKRYFEIKVKEGYFTYQKKENVIETAEDLDGVYILETNTPKQLLTASEVQKGYKNLSKVEQSFRVIKNVLEIRPVHHRKKTTTQGHIFVCFLALYLRRELEIQLAPLLQESTFDYLLTQLREIRQSVLVAGEHKTMVVNKLNGIQRNLVSNLRMRITPVPLRPI